MKPTVAAPGPRFECSACGYLTSHRGHWRVHLRTERHRRATGLVADYVCDKCGRTYKYRQGLHRHRRACKSLGQLESAEVPASKSAAHSELLQVIEQLIPRVNQTTNNNNISIQILLNKECADAMTIQAFATNLRMSLEDICKQKTDGRPAAVSKIVSENLGPLRMQDRPIHCTDQGRSKWLVHDESGGWREDTGSTVVRAASFGITRKFQELWDAVHPNWRNDDKLRSSWIDLVACFNADPSDQEVGATLERLAPHCRLTAEELRASLLIAAAD
jgi:hypothetical protein